MCNVEQRELTNIKVLVFSETIMFILKDCQLVLTISVSQLASVGACSTVERGVGVPAGDGMSRQVRALRDLEPVFLRQMFFPSLIKQGSRTQ